ncbi:MAG: hypothetical protein GWN86_00835 [Desulfobacterales bacterium]|nr:hypothetical protein [Desulfobacterales bacterium]
MIKTLYNYRVTCDNCGKKKIIQSTQTPDRYGWAPRFFPEENLPEGWSKKVVVHEDFGLCHGMSRTEKHYCPKCV